MVSDARTPTLPCNQRPHCLLLPLPPFTHPVPFQAHTYTTPLCLAKRQPHHTHLLRNADPTKIPGGRNEKMTQTTNGQAFITPALPLRTACPLSSSSSSTCDVRSHRRGVSIVPNLSLSSEEKKTASAPAAEESKSGTAAQQTPKTTKKYVPKPPAPFKSSATWSPDFFPGFGRKGVGSDPGWDLRPRSMRAKDAAKTSTITCDSCKGTGKMICTFCEGVTFKSIDGKEIPCPACGDESSVTCSACFGTGKQIELVSFLSLNGMNPPLCFQCFSA